MSGREVPDSVRRTYQERLKYLRRGQEAFQGKEISKAVQFYASYLKALSDYFGIPENHLDPKFFDLQKDKAELLLISQVYWDLSKSYDRSPGLQNECVRCLNQFVKFTIGFKHQHINAQLLKKYVRQNAAVNQQAFKGALKKIQVDSKNCYVASYAFGSDHSITNNLRVFKKEILAKNDFGISLIGLYYDFSPKIIHFTDAFPIVGILLKNLLFKPLIWTVSSTYKVWRKVCSKS